MKAVLALATCLGLTGCIPLHTHALKSAVENYRGDGRIEDVSLGSMIFSSPGFRIVYPSFRSDQEHTAVYRLGPLPVTKQNSLFIWMALPGQDFGETERIKVPGRVEIEIRDETESSVYRTERDLGVAFFGKHYLGDFSAPMFWFDPRQTYTLRMHFVPKGKSPVRQLALEARCGGFK